MTDPLFTLRQALKRSRNPWNWCVQRSGLLLLGAALGLKSGLLFASGIIFLSVSLFELHLPELKQKTVWRLIRMERDWLDAPWSGRKRIQASVLIVLGILLGWSLAVGDLLALLLVLAGATFFGVEAAQHRTMIWLKETEEAENEDDHATRE